MKTFSGIVVAVLAFGFFGLLLAAHVSAGYVISASLLVLALLYAIFRGVRHGLRLRWVDNRFSQGDCDPTKPFPWYLR